MDDNLAVLDGFKIIFEFENFEVVGFFINVKEVVEFFEKGNVDVVFMDIRMFVMDGIEGIFNIKIKFLNVKVIILIIFCEEDYIKKSLSFGVDGYIFKSLDV